MQEIDRIARRQWGLISHEQAMNLMSPKQLMLMKERHRVFEVHRGLYRVAGAPITWQQNIAAALMVLPTGVASFQTAARLHGLSIEADQLVHVTISPELAHQRKNVAIHRSHLLDDHIVVRQRITCTSVERTIVDLAAELSRRHLAFVIDEAIVAGLTTFRKIFDVMEACGTNGRKGMKTLRALLAERLPLAEGSDKKIELNILKAVKKAGLSQPQTQFKVMTRLGPYYIDAAWPDVLIGAESDGYTVHTASRIRHTKDRRRRNELETMGWRILDFTADMTIDEIAGVLRANLR